MRGKSCIVGDAGGTSTQWRIIEDGNISQYETVGFNAYTHKIEDLKQSILETFKEKIDSSNPTYLYAAGVDTQEQRLETCKALQDVFGDSLIVENDLVGVARSLCGKESGNVCILGTGSNACLYDGNKVDKVGASLGYVLGDEGSGAHLGKNLMVGVYRNRFSKKIIECFQEQYHLTSHEAIQKIYNQLKPNHFLASFAPFVFEHRSDPEMHQMIFKSFKDFFNAYFGEKIETTLAFHFSGSIAWYFSDILRAVGSEIGITIGNIVQSPISGLALYHQKNG